MLDTDLADMVVGLVRKETRRLYKHEPYATKRTNGDLLRRCRLAQDALSAEIERIEWRDLFYRD
jgi:hypothetical protein